MPLKPQYRYYEDGTFEEVIHDWEHVRTVPKRGTYLVVWNALAARWEFGLSRGPGSGSERVWDVEHLPAPLQMYLLLLGVS